MPFGHTLEDELNHLRSHDGPGRIEAIANKKHLHYDLDKSICACPKPRDGWSLKEVINVLYGSVIEALEIHGLDPFFVLCAIVCKPPRQDGNQKRQWDKGISILEKQIDLGVARDIVGNTICADFLDYLFRDWHHLGKPLYEDKRLYQYMEVRTRSDLPSGRKSVFVINVGAADGVRHDALTNILLLLEGRYQLAETVLFHRTKLAITALLDRCLLEIHDIYKKIGVTDHDFTQIAETLLLEGSDDALPEILTRLAAGGDEAGIGRLRERIEADRSTIRDAINLGPVIPDLLTSGPARDETIIPETALETQIRTINELINRLRDRCVYTLAYKLRISDFTGPHRPDNPRLKKLIELYCNPENRRAFLRGMEARCNLPSGSLVMYCPPNAAMNAKVAKVNLFIEGEITPFDEYDDKDREDSSLTRGALWAQIRRFYELWSAQVYIERVAWDSLSLTGKKNLREVIDKFFFHMRSDSDLTIVRAQVEASILAVLTDRPMAARDESSSPELEQFADFIFPSGLAFALPPGGQ